MSREFQLDGWRVRPQLCELEGPEGAVAVEAHSVEVLEALAERAGEVVSREELLDRVWGELFVGEEVLTHAVWDLRRALGDDPKSPRFLHTHRKRGYRLTAKVSWLERGVGETGRYRLIEQIGGGAMGIVFRAEDTRLTREVALKFLPPEWSRDEVAKARFLREAKTAAALDHESLCSLYEIDETDDGRLFLVMPFYRGETLKRVLARGPLPAGRVLEIGLRAASGLAALHRKGIVHRDVKPGNLLIALDGGVKILDFGLAKFAGATRLTRTDSSPGTPAYMAPEQVGSDEATPASDVWSLGATLYEAATGRPPFGSSNEEATFWAIRNQEPPPLRLPGAEGLARVVARALAKRPDDRPADGSEMAAELERLADEAEGRANMARAPSAQAVAGPIAGWPRPLDPEPRAAGGGATTGARPARRRFPRRRFRQAAVAALLILLVAAFAASIYLSLRSGLGSVEESPVSRPLRIEVPVFENRTGDPGLDAIGPLAADRVATGLAAVGFVPILAAGKAVESPATAGAEGGPFALAVLGHYSSTGEGLHLRADVLDRTRGQPLRILGPVPLDPAEPRTAIEEIRDGAMTAVSIAVDTPYRPPGLFSHLPRYEAYRELRAALSVPSAADQEKARGHLVRSLELDPDFVVAGLYLAGAPIHLVGNRHKEEILAEVEARRARLTAYERHLADAFLNQFRGRPADALLQLREAERIAPHDPWINAQISDTALWLNRPQEALAAMEAIPLEEIHDPFARWRRVINRGQALHMLGRYEEELEFAQQGLEALPNLPTEPRYAQVRALAALDRFDELDRAIEESRADVSPMWANDGGVWLSLASALQLRAHGRADDARRYAERALTIDRAGARSEIDGPQFEDPRLAAWALWLLGRYDEAYDRHSRLLAEGPDRIFLRGEVGCLAALRGDRDEALRHAQIIAASPKPNVYGIKQIAQGLIHAHLGELDRAVELMAEGLAAGDNYKEYRVHYHVFLSPLLGYPPYEELVRPKG